MNIHNIVSCHNNHIKNVLTQQCMGFLSYKQNMFPLKITQRNNSAHTLFYPLTIHNEEVLS